MNEKLRRSFDHIQAGEDLKRRTGAYLAQRTRSYARKPYTALRWAAAACVFLLTAGLAGIWVFFSPVSAISVDINPSLELGINRFDRVVSVESFNAEGEALAQELNLRFLDYTHALHRLLDDQQVQSYLDQGEGLSILVVCDDQTRSETMLAQVEGCTSGRGNVYCHSGGSEHASEAHAAGLSTGKYQAYLSLKDLDPTVTTEDAQGMTMKEIRDKIQEGHCDSGENCEKASHCDSDASSESASEAGESSQEETKACKEDGEESSHSGSTHSSESSGSSHSGKHGNGGNGNGKHKNQHN